MKLSHLPRCLGPLAALTVVALPTCAVDGVVLINQAAALAGNVTPGDTPGFPVVISVSGSYRLSGNLTVPDANTNGHFNSHPGALRAASQYRCVYYSEW